MVHGTSVCNCLFHFVPFIFSQSEASIINNRTSMTIKIEANSTIMTSKVSKKMEAILHPVLQFYKDNLESSLDLIEILEDQRTELKDENRRLRQRIEDLEIRVAEAEYRADALRRVLDVMAERTERTVRRDLLDAFNEVANELDVDLDMEQLSSDMEDFEREMFGSP